MGPVCRVASFPSTLEGAGLACWGTEADLPTERALSLARGCSDVDEWPTACGLRPWLAVCSILRFFPAVVHRLIVKLAGMNHRAHSERVLRARGGSRLASFALGTEYVDRRLERRRAELASALFGL